MVSMDGMSRVFHLKGDMFKSALFEYFRKNWEREPFPVIDHMLRIDKTPAGNFHFYIHPANTSGITTDYIVTADAVVEQPTQPLSEAAQGIGWAIKQMQNGSKVARAGWNGKGMFLYYVPANAYPPQTGIAKKEWGGNPVPYGAYIAMKTAQGNVVPWLASQTDLLAIDWEIVP